MFSFWILDAVFPWNSLKVLTIYQNWAQSRNLVKSCSAIAANTLHLWIAAKVVHNQTELTRLL
jgi:hypothetical protein